MLRFLWLIQFGSATESGRFIDNSLALAVNKSK
jgi:hypothetical protein